MIFIKPMAGRDFSNYAKSVLNFLPRPSTNNSICPAQLKMPVTRILLSTDSLTPQISSSRIPGAWRFITKWHRIYLELWIKCALWRERSSNSNVQKLTEMNEQDTQVERMLNVKRQVLFSYLSSSFMGLLMYVRGAHNLAT